jgi:hypothetical protein
MFRWTVGLLAAAMFVALLPGARAQSPGNSGMRFVPIDTSRSVAPVPQPPAPQTPKKKSFLTRTGDYLAKVVPFWPHKPSQTNPVPPTNQSQSQKPGNPAPSSGSFLPQIPPLIQGTAH